MKDWKDAHDETDMHITRMQGFAEILYDVAIEFPALSNNQPMTNGILSLIRALREDAHQLSKLHSEEWKLRLQVETEKAA